MRAGLIWAALACLMIGPVLAAAASPLLAYRSVVYIVAGIAGVAALSLLLIQPLLAAGYLPGLSPTQARRWHRWVGSTLALAVVIHIGGLYLTSPPDTLDALILASPTPFSVYGVIGLWSLVLTVVLVAARSKLGLRPPLWRVFHTILASVVVVSSVVHALLIEGTMGTTSKIILCAAVLIVTAATMINLRVVRPLLQNRSK